MGVNRLILNGMTLTIVALFAGCGGGGEGGGGGAGVPADGTVATPYTLGGMVVGLGADESVTITNSGGDEQAIATNGVFLFSQNLPAGGAYAVAVQSHTPGIACSVTDGDGTVGSSSVGNVLVSCVAGTESVLHSFTGVTDGAMPHAGLIVGIDGNLYGTTLYGGASSGGTVFEISPTGTEKIVYALGAGGDGNEPLANLVTDAAGNLYGTTFSGGANGDGTVFKVRPAGTEAFLYSFRAGTDGKWPGSGLVMDASGNLYGTTQNGGTNSNGTVFKISPTGVESVLYSFGTSPDAQIPEQGLAIDGAGNLYGLTENGGANGAGAVFKVTPNGTETVLYSFRGGSDGQSPEASLVRDSAGNLYGTTYQGGTSGNGTVFKVSPNGTETVLYSFGGGTDGQKPYSTLVIDSLGNLYGTTNGGGTNGQGTVFKISPSGTETVLYSFGTGSDAQGPLAGLAVDSAGNLYGTTPGGGTRGIGTVFKID